MENNKRKTETVLEQEESKKKIKICSAEEVCRPEEILGLEKWIKGCRTLKTELPYEEMIREMSSHHQNVLDFYDNLPEVLEKDLALFAEICPIPIAHEIARYWSQFRSSYEKRFLFFVLDYYIAMDAVEKRPSILIRLMEIARFYEDPDRNEKYKHQNSLVSVPAFARIILAVMDHPNLSLIHHTLRPLYIYNENINDNLGFDTIVQQNLYPGNKIINDATLQQSTDMIKANSVQRYNDLLQSRYDGSDDTYLEPQCLKIHQKKSDKTIYCVKK